MPEVRIYVWRPTGSPPHMGWVRTGAAPGTSDVLARALGGIDWPDDPADSAFWCGTEYAGFRAMRRQVRALGLAPDRIVAFAHWRRGMSEPEIATAGSSAIRD